MKIRINDVETTIPDGLTIGELLVHQQVKMPDMVSVQVNGTILNRAELNATQVREHAAFDFLYIIGGEIGRAS